MHQVLEEPHGVLLQDARGPSGLVDDHAPSDDGRSGVFGVDQPERDTINDRGVAGVVLDPHRLAPGGSVECVPVGEATSVEVMVVSTGNDPRLG
ncbi:hypothetical protein R8789_16735 [Streptomyces malaysiensis]|nr:hypothetical protein R8789_16735 [Streptomyces malaysiensis]